MLQGAPGKDIGSDSESDHSHPSDLHLLYNRGETTDDERTETDDDMLPTPPPPLQQYLEQQLELVTNKVAYWGKKVSCRGIQREPKRPDWLPEDWDIKCITRTSGSSAGNRDKYYIEPGLKGRKFRSKREVLQFLETGKRRQYKRKAANNSTAMVPFLEPEAAASTSWQNIMPIAYLEPEAASTSGQNEEETLNLDSDTVPEKQNEEETAPSNVDSDQNPPKRHCRSPSK